MAIFLGFSKGCVLSSVFFLFIFVFNKRAVTLNSAIKNGAGLGAKGACHSEMTQMPVTKDPKRFNVGRSCPSKCLLSSCVLLYVVAVADL